MLFLFWWSPFIPSRNLDEVFTYNHLALMSLRSHSHINASMILMRADYLFIHNYVRSLLNIILIPIIMFSMGLEPTTWVPSPTACVSEALAN